MIERKREKERERQQAIRRRQRGIKHADGMGMRCAASLVISRKYRSR